MKPSDSINASSARVSVSKEMKGAIVAEQRNMCAWCESVFHPLHNPYSIDHRGPVCMGGTSDRCNLQAMCMTCHRAKTNMDLKCNAVRKQRLKAQRASLVKGGAPDTRSAVSGVADTIEDDKKSVIMNQMLKMVESSTTSPDGLILPDGFASLIASLLTVVVKPHGTDGNRAWAEMADGWRIMTDRELSARVRKETDDIMIEFSELCWARHGMDALPKRYAIQVTEKKGDTYLHMQVWTEVYKLLS